MEILWKKILGRKKLIILTENYGDLALRMLVSL
jgi:hypothetical protein